MNARIADPFDRLSAADPLRRVDDAELDERLTKIRARLTYPGPPLVRSRRRSRRTIVVALAVLLAVVLVGTALAWATHVIDFGRSAPADSQAQLAFGDLARAAPAGFDPAAIATEAREVATLTLAGARRVLSVAPTRQGGFCFRWSGLIVTCDATGRTPLGLSVVTPDSASASQTSQERLILGYVSSAYSTRVAVELTGGETSEPDVVWVSAPIGAGFFAVAVPAGVAEGRVVAFDGEGHPVASRPLDPVDLTAGQLAPPSDALVSERREVVTVETTSGEATIVTAPTRYDGACDWLDYHGRFLAFTPCLPAGQAAPPFAFRFVPSPSGVLLVGRVDDSVRSIRISYADGGHDSIDVHEGRVLFDVPADNTRTGAQAVRISGYTSAGELAHTIPVSGLGGADYPCLAPTILRADLTGPFCLAGL